MCSFRAQGARNLCSNYMCHTCCVLKSCLSRLTRAHVVKVVLNPSLFRAQVRIQTISMFSTPCSRIRLITSLRERLLSPAILSIFSRRLAPTLMLTTRWSSSPRFFILRDSLKAYHLRIHIHYIMCFGSIIYLVNTIFMWSIKLFYIHFIIKQIFTNLKVAPFPVQVRCKCAKSAAFAAVLLNFS